MAITQTYINRVYKVTSLKALFEITETFAGSLSEVLERGHSDTDLVLKHCIW